MEERIGKKQLIYDNGKKRNCDYNRFNESYLDTCKYLLYMHTINNIEPLLDFMKQTIQIILVILVLLTSPISLPVLAYFLKKRILKENSKEQLYKWRKLNV